MYYIKLATGVSLSNRDLKDPEKLKKLTNIDLDCLKRLKEDMHKIKIEEVKK